MSPLIHSAAFRSLLRSAPLGTRASRTHSYTSDRPPIAKSLRLQMADPTLRKTAVSIEALGADSASAAPRRVTLKSRLRNGETLYGLFVLSFSPTIAEIGALSGYDFLVLDMEHGPGGISESLHCLRAAAAGGVPAVLRVPETSAAWAKKALDLGPAGVMFPMIDTPDDAKKAVSYCRFPPVGERGSAHPVVRASLYGIDEAYLSYVDEEVLVMCQVESVTGVENSVEIAAVQGVDCVQMGPLDLSASMGYLGEPGHKNVGEMLLLAEGRVLESRGAYLAGFAMPHDPPLNLKARGYKMVSGAVDVALFRSAAVEDVKRFKTSSSCRNE